MIARLCFFKILNEVVLILPFLYVNIFCRLGTENLDVRSVFPPCVHMEQIKKYYLVASKSDFVYACQGNTCNFFVWTLRRKMENPVEVCATACKFWIENYIVYITS